MSSKRGAAQGQYIIRTVLVRPDQLRALDQLAKRQRRSRSWVLRELLDIAFSIPHVQQEVILSGEAA